MGQRRYIHAMKKNDIVFGIGPAGTGKTYLAVVMAVRALKARVCKENHFNEASCRSWRV